MRATAAVVLTTARATRAAFVSPVRMNSTFPTALAATDRIVSVHKDSGKTAQLSFADGSVYDFHALWLRDACRDPQHVEAESERVRQAALRKARRAVSTELGN